VAFRADNRSASVFGAGASALPFPIEIFDVVNAAPANTYNTATSIFTAPLDGVYHFDLAVNILRLAGQPTVVLALISNNGSAPIQRWVTAFDVEDVDDEYGATVSGDFLLRAGQTVTPAILLPVGSQVATTGLITSSFSGGLTAEAPPP
jgi:hypothetical protein